MLKNSQARRARRLGDNYFVLADSQTRFCKRSLTAINYAFASSIVALSLAYWPASTAAVVAKLSIIRAGFTSAAPIPDRTHKAGRLYVITFDQRWSAVPAQSTPIRSESGEHKQPQVERRLEKIPFSCELAFSRLVAKGNFSTRCIARGHEFATVAFA